MTTRAEMKESAIEAMTPDDWPAVRSIYEDGIATRNATFETSAPEWEAWDAARRPDCRLVARVDGRVVGWSALSPYSSRHAYRGVGEVSVYVAASARGKGVGRALLRALIDSAEAAGVWTLQAGIFPENEVSIRLHAAEGFRVVGRRERIGQLDGEWRDVVLMERRSASVG
jgi:L-amino acid N-acyltransferase YncA